MKPEDKYLVRALLLRMKLAAQNPEIARLSDEIMTLIAGNAPLPPMPPEPKISWAGNTMVVR